MGKIAALFVEKNGVYFNHPLIDPWDVERNAFLYRGPEKVIAHPPCKRWGKYWSGGPSAKIKRLKGDDGNCFAHALWCVRTFGGIIEHPEGSWAWEWFGLRKPSRTSKWIRADNFGGLTCSVEQGHYGHRARKATWLYMVGCWPIDLAWGVAHGKMPLEESFRSSRDRKHYRSIEVKPRLRVTAQERLATPVQFRDLLIQIVSS